MDKAGVEDAHGRWEEAWAEYGCRMVLEAGDGILAGFVEIDEEVEVGTEGAVYRVMGSGGSGVAS